MPNIDRRFITEPDAVWLESLDMFCNYTLILKLIPTSNKPVLMLTINLIITLMKMLKEGTLKSEREKNRFGKLWITQMIHKILRKFRKQLEMMLQQISHSQIQRLNCKKIRMETLLMSTLKLDLYEECYLMLLPRI